MISLIQLGMGRSKTQALWASVCIPVINDEYLDFKCQGAILTAIVMGIFTNKTLRAGLLEIGATYVNI